MYSHVACLLPAPSIKPFNADTRRCDAQATWLLTQMQVGAHGTAGTQEQDMAISVEIAVCAGLCSFACEIFTQDDLQFQSWE